MKEDVFFQMTEGDGRAEGAARTAAAAAVPIIFVVALAIRNGEPRDVAFGRSVWLFPLITALVAGDIVAAEDRDRTLKTILTRSVERQQVFAAKTLATVTYAVAAIALSGIVALVAGIIASGFNPIVTLSGAAAIVGTLMFSLNRDPARPRWRAALPAEHPVPGLGASSGCRSTGRRSSALRGTCALYAVPALVVGSIVFLRRDVAGE